MTLNFKILKTVKAISFSIGVDFEEKCFFITFFYFALVITKL